MADNDPTAEWPPMPEVRTDAGRSFRIDALEARLRTTAETLRLCQWALREPLDNWKGECERKALDASRAILARLEQEGLT